MFAAAWVGHHPALAQSSGGPQAFLGVRLDSTTAGPVRLVSVLPGSAAERAGLVRGDLIEEVGGQRVASADDVIARVQASRVGERLQVVVTRSGQRQTVPVSLDAAPAPGQILTRFVGHAAPAWSLPGVAGGTVDLAGLRGRVVIVYFWSLSCGACRVATPSIDRWSRAFRDQGLSIVAISNDPLNELQRAGSTTGFSFPLAHDLDSKIGSEYWVSAVPTFFVIDRNGAVAQVMEGWDPIQARAMEAEIQRLLARRAP
jgi:peroxiredoxin